MSKIHLNRIGRVFLVAMAIAWTALAHAAETPIKIRIAYPSGMNGQIPVVMERAGIAKKYGLDADYNFFQYGPPMMEALTAGSIDVVFAGPMPITSFISRLPGRALLVAQLGASSYSLMVPKDSAVKELRDLRGKRLALSYSTDSQLLLLRALRDAGIDTSKDITLINAQPNDLMSLFVQGLTDAILIRVPQVERMQEQYGARIVQTWPFYFWAIMRADYLKQNPDARERFLETVRNAILYTANNREQAAQWFGERLRLDAKIVLHSTGTDPLFQVNRIEDVKIGITPAQQKYLEEWAAASLEFGLIKTRVDVQTSIAR